MNITLLIITYNHENFILDCLQSAINQKKEFSEILIIDNCSKDSTVSIIEKFILEHNEIKFKFVKNKTNIGINNAMNLGLSTSTSEIVCCMSGDDLSNSDRSLLVENYLKKHKTVNIFLSSYNIIDDNNNILKVIKRNGFFNDIKKIIRKGSGLPTYGLVIRRRWYVKNGGVSSFLENEDDALFFLGLVDGGIFLIPEVLYSYRIHEKSFSSWLLFSKNSEQFKSKFLEDQSNRVANLECWLNIVKKSSLPNKFDLEKLIKNKIDLSTFYRSLDKLSPLKRLSLLIYFKNIIGVRDLMYLLFGINGPIIFKNMKKYILRR